MTGVERITEQPAVRLAGPATALGVMAMSAQITDTYAGPVGDPPAHYGPTARQGGIFFGIMVAFLGTGIAMCCLWERVIKPWWDAREPLQLPACPPLPSFRDWWHRARGATNERTPLNPGAPVAGSIQEHR